MKLMVAIPGRQFSGKFLECWTAFLAGAIADGIEVSLSRKYSPNIYHSRTLTLGGDLRRGKGQLPFNGQPYDLLLFIDSDSIFTYSHFKQLLSRNLDIVAAYYSMEDGRRAAVVKCWDSTTLTKTGTMEFSKLEDFIKLTEPISVSYMGLGFCLIKYGVLESVGYPWGNTPLQINIGDSQKEIITEDIAFCLESQSRGYQTFIDPLARVGHEKMVIL